MTEKRQYLPEHMQPYKVTPLYAEPFMVDAVSEQHAREQGHERLHRDHPSWNGSVIYRCETLMAEAERVARTLAEA